MGKLPLWMVCWSNSVESSQASATEPPLLGRSSILPLRVTMTGILDTSSVLLPNGKHKPKRKFTTSRLQFRVHVTEGSHMTLLGLEIPSRHSAGTGQILSPYFEANSSFYHMLAHQKSLGEKPLKELKKWWSTKEVRQTPTCLML